ncbi:hypothetical protein [Thermoflexibacter ruber]|uniref:DUF3052 domain-containing protein n=1 Tax=Thermoflexibacter ruber TaxID=1003 RepID=A0A1I2B4S2_9BACT|nr:hypothetical protein [Thermoflexibacter ruber]SFE51059.1 hypothetical protein SAMN04488541_1002132 [Thermoflexibacter ruber]
MNAIFAKMNFKNQSVIHVINAPESFVPVLNEMSKLTEIKAEVGEGDKISFIVVFVSKQQEVDEWAAKISPLLQGDGLLWFAYPKGTSKKYKCEFNRDTGWQILGKLGFEGVRQIAIDEDWSALRFRRVEYIKQMKRDEKRAMSTGGKEKVKKSN